MFKNLLYGFVGGYWAAALWHWLMDLPEEDDPGYDVSDAPLG